MSSSFPKRRVVITGVGLVTPLAVGTRATWEALLQGRSGVGPITKFDASAYESRIAGEVKGFDPTLFLEKKEIKKADAFIQYGMAAAHFALADSGFAVTDENSARTGVIIGSGIGGLPLIESMHEILRERGPARISPFFIPGLIANMAAGQVS